MIPGLGGINPKKMQGMLKQMGISQEDIQAERVIIEQADSKIIINNPAIQKVKMQGQESFQISGDITEESKEVTFSEEDISLVAEKTNKTKEEAREALEETKDITEAILKLSE